MHDTGASFVGIRAAQLRATSARPDAPVLDPTPGELRAERHAHRRRTRRPRVRPAVATLLHRTADALAPRPEHVRPVR